MKLMIDVEECIGCGQCKSVCIRDNIEIDEVSFSADGIMNSIPYDQWQAGTDSSFAIWKDNGDEPFLWSI